MTIMIVFFKEYLSLKKHVFVKKKIREGILIKEKHFFLYYLKSLKYFKIFILITFSFNAVNHIAKKISFLLKTNIIMKK
jgi:hypothetical protein